MCIIVAVLIKFDCLFLKYRSELYQVCSSFLSCYGFKSFEFIIRVGKTGTDH